MKTTIRFIPIGGYGLLNDIVIRKLERKVPAYFLCLVNVSFKETYRTGENSKIKSQGRTYRKVM